MNNDDGSSPAKISHQDQDHQMQIITNPPQSTSSIPTRANATVHCAEAKLLLRRAAAETRDPIEIRSLRDLANVLQYVIEQLEETR